MELYDLDADVGETRNVAGQHPEVVEQMVQHAQAFQWPERLFEPAIGLPPSKKQMAKKPSEQSD